MSTVYKTLIAAALIAALAGCTASESESDLIKAQLAPTGVLRAGINYSNPLLARRNAETGELTGLAVDLSQELARRFDLEVELIPYDSAGKMASEAANDVWDIAYLAIDPARAETIDYSAAHSELEGSYLVPPGSPFQSIEDVDQEEVRIASSQGAAYDLFLSRSLQHAELVRADSSPAAFDLFVEQKLDALAGVKASLGPLTERLPGSRLLPGRFMAIPQAAGIPRGRPEAARYVREFIEEMKASGFIAEAFIRHGLGPDDAIVAAPAPVE